MGRKLTQRNHESINRLSIPPATVDLIPKHTPEPSPRFIEPSDTCAWNNFLTLFNASSQKYMPSAPFMIGNLKLTPVPESKRQR
jgi:hypothetical protein